MPPESKEVSVHRVMVFRFIRRQDRWLSNHEIATGSGVAGRTARQHTKALVDLGILDEAMVFPGHRFRLSSFAEQRNKPYLKRLEDAETILAPALLESTSPGGLA